MWDFLRSKIADYTKTTKGKDSLLGNLVRPKIISPLPERSMVKQPRIATKIMPKMPKPTAMPKMKPAKPYEHNISIPGSQGGTTRVPSSVAQHLMENFDDIGEATNSATVLHHPRMQTYTPREIKDKGGESWNYGENASFITNPKNPRFTAQNPNGSYDRGLMRINSDTLNGMLAFPHWREQLRKIGVSSYDDIKDLKKNVQTARLVLDRGNWDNSKLSITKNPSWRQWFAAPLALRDRTSNLAKK